MRESEISWTEVLLGLKERGLKASPRLCVGDGALGFWNALYKVYGTKAKIQRCWFHKMGNILNKLPKNLQNNAKSTLQQIWMAQKKEDATKSFDKFIKIYGDKYPKAADCLNKDREALLAFYDFPAAHWQHLRTTNPIESVFATVRLRTAKTKGCLSHKTGELMAFKLMESAAKRWIRLRGSEHTAKVIRGVNFKNGIECTNNTKEIKLCAA